MTATVKASRINRHNYGRLLAIAQPEPIKNDEDYERTNSEIRKLLKRGDRLTVEEDRLLDLLTVLVERYDDEHYQIPRAQPHEVIQFLMADRELRNRDLIPVLGSSGVTSDVIGGKRRPSEAQIQRLAAFFGAPPAVFVYVPAAD